MMRWFVIAVYVWIALCAFWAFWHYRATQRRRYRPGEQKAVSFTPLHTYIVDPHDEHDNEEPPGGLTCPFCGETDFDKIGLKNHLLSLGCDEFELHTIEHHRGES